jgi:predicted phage tail protein
MDAHLKQNHDNLSTSLEARQQPHPQWGCGFPELLMNKGFATRPKGAGLKKKQTKPREDAESGISTSYARLLGVLSEGPIEGPIGWAKGIYFDETPLQNADGSYNFQGLSFDFRPGTRDQGPIPGYTDDATSETPVGSEVKYNLPVTRSFTNANLDQIVVRLGFQLQEYPPEGGYRTLPIEFRILIKQGLGAFVEVYRTTITERWSSPVELSYGFNVNNQGGTVNDFAVRVERLTPQDTDTTRYQRTMTFKVYAEVVGTRVNYAYSALAALQFDATQFDSLPQVAFEIGGRLIKIPNNATVNGVDRGLDYTGTWDGESFIEAPIACADPAWIFYDLLTNKRYGLGRYIDASKINKWQLYSLSQYCNEVIPVSGTAGGTERRYQCHVLIQDKEEAWKVLEAFRSIFRGFLYWMEGTIHLSADRPTNPTMIVTQADVERGSFSYSRTPLRARHTIAHVTWLDKDNFYKRTIETVEDQIGIERYGPRELEMSAFACVSQSQAHRAGWAAVLSDRLELETVRFRLRPYAAYLVPGAVLKLMDIKRSIVRFGGLVAGATDSTITLDHPVDLLSGEPYMINLMQPDGSTIEKPVYTNAGAGVTSLEFDALTEPVEVESPWILTSPTVLPGLYRALGIVPVSGENNLLYEVSALQYDPSKYDKIDTDYYIPAIPPPPRIPSVVPPPLNLQGKVEQQGSDILLNATWERPVSEYITGYFAEYKLNGGEWGNRLELAYPAASWDVSNQAPYRIRVATVDVYGNVSVWVEIEVQKDYANINYDWSIAQSMLTPMFF